ncbi:MAG TPA: amidohydrolase family protein, partial [Bacillota bacterium]|nr:amidohydrolase family protein [Bacillota bacterium]
MIKLTTSLLLRNAHVVDPVSRIDGVNDVGISDGKIVAVAPCLSPADFSEVYDLCDYHLIPGIVDLHVHASEWLGGSSGHKMLAEAGVTTALDMSGPIDGVLRMAARHGAGLNIASIEYVRPGETVADANPSSSEIATLLDRVLAAGSIGLKLLGGHYPLTPAATAEAIRVANQHKAYVAFHAGSMSTGSHIEGMLEAIRLADGGHMHLAHVNSYCRGAVRGHMEETEEAIAALIANPNIVSESYLGLINGTSAQCINGVPASKVTERCLKLGGFAPDESGMEAAILAGWAQINMESCGRVILAVGEQARDYWRALGTNAPVSFAVNPPEPRLRLAAARRPDGNFVVDAISTDGGGIPRNVILGMGLSLVKLEVLTMTDFIRKISLNPAQILGLKDKGHLSPGADADITVFDYVTQKPIMTLVNGRFSMYHGLIVGQGSSIITTQR